MGKFTNALKKIEKFGFRYSFFYFLKKIGLIEELGAKHNLIAVNYYRSLPTKNQIKELSEFYENAVGHPLDFDNPVTFTEKLQWLKFYDSTRQKADLSDKYLAPQLVESRFKSQIKIIPLLGVWKSADDIDFDALPQKFVLKCNHGSAMNIIVRDKSRLNIKKTRRRLDNWLKIDYAYVNGMYENHYTFIERRIIAEQFIEEKGGNLHDYKFHCFNGEPKFIEFIGDRVANTHTIHSSLYTTDWKRTDICFNNDTPYEEDFEKPGRLSEMLSLAREMARDYCYVRVDFYYIGGEIYFGELTFTPDSGIIKFNRTEIDAEWGEMIALPQRTEKDVFAPRKRIAWLPYNLSENHFIRELKAAAEMAGAENVPDDVLWHDGKSVDYLVLNFYENLEKKIGFYFTTYLGKLLRLLKFRVQGIKIVFVVNNKLPHDQNRKYSKNLMKCLILLSDKIIALSSETRILLKELCPNEKKWEKKVFMLPHPNYIGSYAISDEPPVADGTFRILFFGSIRPYKNIDVLITAFKKLNNPNIVLTIAGKTKSGEYREYISSLAAGVPNIRLRLEYIPDDGIAPLLSSAHILCLPYDNETTLNSGAVILACSAKKTFIVPLIGTVKDFPDRSLMYTYEYETQLEHRDRLALQIQKAYEDFKKDEASLREKGEALYEYIKTRHGKETLSAIFKRELGL